MALGSDTSQSTKLRSNSWALKSSNMEFLTLTGDKVQNRSLGKARLFVLKQNKFSTDMRQVLHLFKGEPILAISVLLLMVSTHQAILVWPDRTEARKRLNLLLLKTFPSKLLKNSNNTLFFGAIFQLSTILFSDLTSGNCCSMSLNISHWAWRNLSVTLFCAGVLQQQQQLLQQQQHHWQQLLHEKEQLQQQLQRRNSISCNSYYNNCRSNGTHYPTKSTI